MADGFEENVEFFTMTYEAPRPVAHNRVVRGHRAVAVAQGGVAGTPDREDKARLRRGRTRTLFCSTLTPRGASSQPFAEAESVRIAFIITDDDRGFQMVCGELPTRVEAVRLYESYLTNFTINTGRE